MDCNFAATLPERYYFYRYCCHFTAGLVALATFYYFCSSGVMFVKVYTPIHQFSFPVRCCSLPLLFEGEFRQPLL